MATVSELAWERAARAAGVDPPERVRPGPAPWLRYAAWRPIGARYRGWVLYDTTCSTWILRHLARLLALAALPLLALAIWLPASGEVRALTCLTTGLCAILFPTMYVNEATDHRLGQAGWRPEVGPLIREMRANYGQSFANAVRRDRAEERRSRRPR
jgi:hypothetical protein